MSVPTVLEKIVARKFEEVAARRAQVSLAEVEAASGRPAALIDGEMASWYGSRAVAGLRYLAALRRASAGVE